MDAGQPSLLTPGARGVTSPYASSRDPSALLASILLVGLEWGPPLVTLGYVRVVEKESWRKSVAIALALAAVLWLIFDRALGVALYEGALGEVIPRSR